jgi:integrase/recombinase XerD
MSPEQGAVLYAQALEARHQSPATLRSVRMYTEWFAAWMMQHNLDDLRDLTLQTLLDYHSQLLAKRNASGGKNSIAYVNAQMWHVRGMLRLLHRRGKLLTDPSRNLPPLRKPKRLPKAVLTGDQVNRLLRQPDVKTLWGFRDRAMLELLYSSGLRGLEVIRLSVHDIDWREKTVRIVQGKGRKDRVVPIGASALAYLREYLDRVRPALLVGHSYKRLVQEKLFFSRQRTPVTGQYLRLMIARYAQAAGVPVHVTTHSIRHACATEMLKGGASVRHVQEMLGHAHLSTTQVYTHVLPYDLKAVHARTAPSERRRVIDVPTFEARAFNDRKNSGHYRW